MHATEFTTARKPGRAACATERGAQHAQLHELSYRGPCGEAVALSISVADRAAICASLRVVREIVPRIDVSHLRSCTTRADEQHSRFQVQIKVECKALRTAWAHDAYNVELSVAPVRLRVGRVAHFVIEQVAESLKTGACSSGSSVHPESGPFENIEISLPGDEKRMCIEYSAPRANVSAICSKYGLKEVLWVGFDDYYATQREKYEKLFKRMRAFASPVSQNAVFVYVKV